MKRMADGFWKDAERLLETGRAEVMQHAQVHLPATDAFFVCRL